MKYIFFTYDLSLEDLIEKGYGSLLEDKSYTFFVEEREKRLKKTIEKAQEYIEFLSSNLQMYKPPTSYFNTEFMSADQKKKLERAWRQFVFSGFRQDKFTKPIYNHLHLHCGFIAHYNLPGFYSTYFRGYSLFPGMSYEKQYQIKHFSNRWYAEDLNLPEKEDKFYLQLEAIPDPERVEKEFLKTLTWRLNFSGDYRDINYRLVEILKEGFEHALKRAAEELAVIQREKKLHEKELMKIRLEELKKEEMLLKEKLSQIQLQQENIKKVIKEEIKETLPSDVKEEVKVEIQIPSLFS